ncbi:MAG: response regulator [Deltaproteobacteria bacterium]|uniref:Response regulator n=1 Tax=Candidatus Zymogenus saltonus TaxID=2844893 RepID=A0A9D8KDC7_9DELT|nr:response regulator [Candidatus Zymogenus saltonus]
MARTVLVVDDSTFMRNRIKEALEGDELTVAGEAKDGDEAIALYRELRPDLVTMDVTMRNTDGFTAAEVILKEFPDANLVLLTLRQEAEKHFLEEAAKKMGIKAVILKPFKPEELKASILGILKD